MIIMIIILNSNNWNGVWDNKCALLVIKGGKSRVTEYV